MYRLSDCLHQLLQKIPAGIGIAQRVVLHIAVTVQGLQIGAVTHKGVGTQKTPNLRIIHPSAHMDKADVVQLVMPGKALVGGGAVQCERRNGQVATLVGGETAPVAQDALQLRQTHGPSLAPGIETEGFHLCPALVGDHGDAAQVVLVQVAGFDCPGAARGAVGVGDEGGAPHRMALFGGAPGQGHLLVVPAHMDRGGDLAAVVVAAGQQLPLGEINGGIFSIINDGYRCAQPILRAGRDHSLRCPYLSRIVKKIANNTVRHARKRDT